jgi:gentisate 1,2-dioxygenase
MQERIREREPEPESVTIDPYYEDLLEADRNNIDRLEKGAIVTHARDYPWHQNRNARVKYLLHPARPETAVSDTLIFVHEIRKHSGMHRHQGGLAIFVLEGKGHTLANGVPHEWEAGDLLLLPLVPGGIDHQHFNDGEGRARWLALIFWPWMDLLANQMVQVSMSPEWADVHSGDARAEVLAQPRGDVTLQVGLPRAEDGTLLDALFRRRDEYRAMSATGELVVRGHDLAWESNQQGRTRWYLHPDKRDAVIRNLLVAVQEIPPGSRTGRQLHPGGLVHYVLEGHGFTVVNGTRHAWEAGDCIALPRRPMGLEFQHFNADPDRPAQLVAMLPNLLDPFGADLGARFEQLEVAPEYRRNSASGETGGPR